jgi:hypothetical protein
VDGALTDVGGVGGSTSRDPLVLRIKFVGDDGHFVSEVSLRIGSGDGLDEFIYSGLGKYSEG